MIKNLKVLAAATAAAVFSMGAAQAAANWTGPYVGATAGVTSFKTDTADYWCWYACDAPGNSEVDVSGGLTAGYNWQLGSNFVVGLEADISTGAKSSETVTFYSGDGVTWASKWDWLATVRGRAGLAVDKTLVFVTGGVAVAKAEYDATYFNPTPADRASKSGNLTGLVIGAGVEHMFTKNLTFKAEYLRVAMPKKSACWADASTGVCYDPGNVSDNDDSVHWTSSADIFRVGVNYKF